MKMNKWKQDWTIALIIVVVFFTSLFYNIHQLKPKDLELDPVLNDSILINRFILEISLDSFEKYFIEPISHLVKSDERQGLFTTGSLCLSPKDNKLIEFNQDLLNCLDYTVLNDKSWNKKFFKAEYEKDTLIQACYGGSYIQPIGKICLKKVPDNPDYVFIPSTLIMHLTEEINNNP